MACILLLSGIVLGQEPQKELSDATLEELLSTRVYTASRFMQDANQAPSFITVVTGDEIRHHGYRTLADVVRVVGGFYVNDDRNYSYVGIRGFLRAGDYNSRVLVMVDGHRLNDNVYEEGFIGSEFPVDVALIERVEFVRGPSSAVYGTNACFGVINIITRKTLEAPAEASFEAGSFGAYQGRISYAGTLRRWKFLMSGTFYNSAGRTLYYPEYDSPLTDNGVSRNSDDEVSSRLLVNAQRGKFTVQAVYGGREKGFPTGAFNTAFNDPLNRTIDDRGYVDARYERNLGHGLSMLSRAYYDSYRYRGWYDVAPSGQRSDAVMNYDHVIGDWAGGELRLNYANWPRHNVFLTTEFRDNIRQRQDNYDVQPYFRYLADSRSSHNYSFGVEDEYRVARDVTLDLGLRHDQYSTFGGSTNPRVALVYRPAEATSFRVVYGSAFRAPNAYELFYSSVSYETNPHLRPEQLKETEIIVSQRLARGLLLTGSWFHNNAEQLIAASANGEIDKTVFGNLASTQSTGFDGQLLAFNDHYRARASYTYQNSQDGVTSAPLANSPRHLANGSITVPMARNRLFFSIDGLYMSRRITPRGAVVGGFGVANVTLFSSQVGRHADVSASIYNLFDKHYADPASWEHRQNSIPQDGRNFRVKLTWRF